MHERDFMDKIYYTKGYEYQLEKPLVILTGVFPVKEGGNDFVYLEQNGLLTINKGYAWDGPSGPAIHTANFMRGSLVHDALYQLIRLGVLDEQVHRDVCDRLLQTLVLEDGMNKARAWWVYTAVHWFGGMYMKNKDTGILKAP